MTIEYVVGFAFSKTFKEVLLIEKLKPIWQKGLLNGVGGKIEKDETPSQAMSRECMEETGLDLNWIEKGMMYGVNNNDRRFRCYLFSVFSDEIYNFIQKEEEELDIWAIEAIPHLNVVNNLRYLIPYCLYGNNSRLYIEYQSN